MDSYIGSALDLTVKFGHESFMYPFVRLFVSDYHLSLLMFPNSPIRSLPFAISSNTDIETTGILVANLYRLLLLPHR